MRSLLLSPCALALFFALHSASARLHSLPEDTYAFPKFSVAFMNGQPVISETAERWLKGGLRGGELEFLDQPWKDENEHPASQRKEIGSGGDENVYVLTSPPSPASANYTLERMKMGPRDSYICLIPKPLENVPSSQEEEAETEVTPTRSWSLLQPLSGTCLYHRQGWFTYSYCHNDEIRQFKELIPPHSRSGGAHVPEEDPEWESYTLGRAPTIPEPGADLTVAEKNARAANLELARTAGSRYLVQRWGDGTICDKTGRPREVEVQFHCSMTMTDHILFVKEAKTCSYVLVVNTPRLCGEPGFRSPRDQGEEAQIRCREIVDTKTEGQSNLPTTDHPLKMPRRKTVPAPPPIPVKDKLDSKIDPAAVKDQEFATLLKKTLEAIMAKQEGTVPGGKVLMDNFAGDGEVVIELMDEPALEGEQVETADRIVEALRAVGYDVTAQLVAPKGAKKKSDNKVDTKGKKDGKRKLRKFTDDFNDAHREEL
ncbi:hypothetical protein BDQ12DRAFT_676603 [Crucibulum laeve]|uniref:Protein OS-9 homolog n=1 Tax=Crucibulum laeve TaxID=68775 RepID=A0A5C3MNC1_9AGAR|nr:hypothetical protein BDQ12DRAFT_676603 [Crucibulum laeve]